jgi:hypothetical protein
MSKLMSKRMGSYVTVAILATAGTLLVHGNAGAQEAQEESAYTVMSEDHHVHIFPTVSKATELASIGMAGIPLSYHGGPVMTKANTYAIFWAPATLQTRVDEPAGALPERANSPALSVPRARDR